MMFCEITGLLQDMYELLVWSKNECYVSFIPVYGYYKLIYYTPIDLAPNTLLWW